MRERAARAEPAPSAMPARGRRAFVTAVALAAVHAVLVVLSPRLPDALAALAAGSVFVPLWPLASLGLPVLGPAAAGGWAGPSALGWVVVVLVWLGAWFGLVRVALRVIAGWRRSRG